MGSRSAARSLGTVPSQCCAPHAYTLTCVTSTPAFSTRYRATSSQHCHTASWKGDTDCLSRGSGSTRALSTRYLTAASRPFRAAQCNGRRRLPRLEMRPSHSASTRASSMSHASTWTWPHEAAQCTGALPCASSSTSAAAGSTRSDSKSPAAANAQASCIPGHHINQLSHQQDGARPCVPCVPCVSRLPPVSFYRVNLVAYRYR